MDYTRTHQTHSQHRADAPSGYLSERYGYIYIYIYIYIVIRKIRFYLR